MGFVGQISTNVNMLLKWYNFLPQLWKELLIVVRLNVKMVQGYGPENRTSDIPI